MEVFFFVFFSLWTVSWLEILTKKLWVAKWATRDILISSQRKYAFARIFLGGASGVFFSYQYQSLGAAVVFSSLGWLSVLIWETDIVRLKIPSEPVWFIVVVGMLAGILTFKVQSWVLFLIGAVMLGLVFLVTAFFTKGGLGSGDVRLVLALSTMIFWTGLLPVSIGILVGLVLQLLVRFVLILKKKSRKYLPLAPMLTLGVFLAVGVSSFSYAVDSEWFTF